MGGWSRSDREQMDPNGIRHPLATGRRSSGGVGRRHHRGRAPAMGRGSAGGRRAVLAGIGAGAVRWRRVAVLGPAGRFAPVLAAIGRPMIVARIRHNGGHQKRHAEPGTQQLAESRSHGSKLTHSSRKRHADRVSRTISSRSQIGFLHLRLIPIDSGGVTSRQPCGDPLHPIRREPTAGGRPAPLDHVSVSGRFGSESRSPFHLRISLDVNANGVPKEFTEPQLASRRSDRRRW